MTITPHLVHTEPPADALALLEVAASKGGKSWLAGTAPGTILFLDFDRRSAALRAHPNAKNIYSLEFADSTDSKIMPTAMSDGFAVMNKIEQRPFLQNVHASFPDLPIDTLVLDSIQTIANAARNYTLFNAGSQDGISRNFSIGQRIVRVPKSYTAWGSEMEMTTSLVLQARSMLHCRKCWKSVTSWTGPSGQYTVVHTDELVPGGTMRKPDMIKADHEPSPKAMNVIVTLHETPEEDPRSTEETPLFTGKIVVYPVRYRTLLIYFNEVWRLTRERGRVPVVTCDPDGQFTQAATALGIPLNTKLEPNIQQIISLAKNKG